MPAPPTARAVIFRPGATPEVTTIDTSLEAMQALVGGYLDGLKLPGALFLYFDEEGRTKGSVPCAFVDGLGDVVVGVCVATAVDDSGEIRSLTDDEIATVRKLVTPVGFVAPGRFQA